jgi:predicted ATP-binding protein involved in virulence
MKISLLQLENFRGFEKLELPLEPSLTLLIGENGAGKTAILEALAVALGGLFLDLPGATGWNLSPDDVRYRVYKHAGLLDLQRQWPVCVTAEGTIDGKPVRWSRALQGEGGRTTRAGAADLKKLIQKLVRAVKAGKGQALPLMAYYGTQRLFRHKKVTQEKRGVGSRYDGYVDALDPASNHRLLTEWMHRQTLVELQGGKPVLQLRAVERAILQCIEGTIRFFFDVESQGLQLQREDGELIPFELLSDGYRNLVAMVADIAWRAAVLNPHFGVDAAARTTGIVLIDEVDLHLHPRWQRQVLGDLRRTFPGLQLVATTHSPQVIASARREEMRVLDRGALLPLRPFVEGRDTNSLLEDVFGVSDRPQGTQDEIDEVAQLLDDEAYASAEEKLAHIEARLGPDDPAVIRARWTLEREASTKEAR